MLKKPSSTNKPLIYNRRSPQAASLNWQFVFHQAAYRFIGSLFVFSLINNFALAAPPANPEPEPPVYQQQDRASRLANMHAEPGSKNIPLPRSKSKMDDTDVDMFILGRSFFSIPWVIAPSATTARDGLGPLFNANTCTSCHRNNLSSDVDFAKPNRSLVIKLAQPSQHHLRGNNMLVEDPVYGAQLAINGTYPVPPEGTPTFKMQKSSVKFADGTVLALQKPIAALKNLNYGKLDPKTTFGMRQSPSVRGLGWIMLVSDAALLANADPDDKNKDGIRGRPNYVFDLNSQSIKIGRFGYKASQRSILTQSADAAANDMGLTNRLHPHELCTSAQKLCREAPRGRRTRAGNFDLTDERLDAIAFYVHNLPAPPKVGKLNPQQQQGQQLFAKLGCQSCHRPSLPTVAGVDIAPYSDFLLHDMGSDLQDGRREFTASERDWRTAPLWGTGIKNKLGKHFLHDGRASSAAEAIAWHGGEAQNAKREFLQLSLTQRQALLAFLDAL